MEVTEQPTAPYYVGELADSGARFHGAGDPAFQTIDVLVGAL